MRRAATFLLILAFGCGVRTERMVPNIGPPGVPLGAQVVGSVEASSDYSAASLRVVAPSDLAEVLRQGLARAGVYGSGGRYALRATIIKLEGGSSGGFNRYAFVTVEARLVDDRQPSWDWHERITASPGFLRIPGLPEYSGMDAQREAFEAAVRQVAGTIVEHVRDTLVRRAAATAVAATPRP